MALTAEQQVTLKAEVEVDPVLSLLPGSNASADIVRDNFNAVGTFEVWKTFLLEADIVSLTSPEATVWNWTDYIGTSAAEKSAWERMFNGTFSINPSLPQVRAGIAEIFSSPGDADQRAHLLAMGKRFSNRTEKLFATGTGTNVDPATMDFEGQLNQDDVTLAMGW